MSSPKEFSLFTQSTNESFALTVHCTVRTKEELDWLCSAILSMRDFLPFESPTPEPKDA